MVVVLIGCNVTAVIVKDKCTHLKKKETLGSLVEGRLGEILE